MWLQTAIVYWELLLIITYAQSISSIQYGSACEQLKACQCMDLEEYGMGVDCVDAHLKVEDVCQICNKIRNVTYLNISTNALTKLPSLCFKDCDQLIILSAANNSLTTLEIDTFFGLSELRNLDLNANKLIKNGNISNPEFLRPLKKLTLLLLQSNSNNNDQININEYLPNIPENVIPDLRTLYLDGLPNATFGENFKQWKRLNNLYFSGQWAKCNISVLTNETFRHLIFLTNLRLSHCKIRFVEAGTFSLLTELRYLDMSSNLELGFPSLRNVSYGLQFTKIIELHFSKVYKTFGLTTQLNRCDVWFLRNTSLKSLYINSNRLALIEINALAFFPKDLEELYAEDNKLTYGQYALQLGCLENLRNVSIDKQDQAHSIAVGNEEMFLQDNEVDSSGGCKATDYPEELNCTISLNSSKTDVTIPERLESIDFRSSSVTFDPAFFMELSIKNPGHVNYLDLSGNIMSNLQGSFFRSDMLLFLFLSNNFCFNISTDFFRNFPNLQYLDLSNNKLGPLLASAEDGAIFEPLKHVFYLDLSENWIQFLPKKIFSHLQGLQRLNLSSNRLENITFQSETLNRLSHLDVSQNKITTLSLDLLKQMDNYGKQSGETIVINLSGNILSALCNNLPFLIWMKEHSSYFFEIQTYNFQNEHKSYISYEELLLSFDSLEKSCKSYTVVIVFSTVFVAVFIVLIIVGVVYRYRWRLRYMYYMVKARYNGYVPLKDREGDVEFTYDAFISYANENYRFVTGDMLQKLEESGLRLCLHQKDFLPGRYIAENILHAIRNSKKTVLVLSNDFLNSKWCMYEFNMARMESICSRDGESVVVVVKYAAFDVLQATPELRECLESESYLEYTQDEQDAPYFWNMLIDAIRSR